MNPLVQLWAVAAALVLAPVVMVVAVVVVLMLEEAGVWRRLRRWLSR